MPEIETAHRSLPDLCAERGGAESKSERDDGCAKAGAAGQNLGESGSGQRRRAKCIRSGTSRKETVGAAATGKRVRESRSRVQESRGEWFWPVAKDERVRSGTSRKETVGAQRPEPSARISGESGSSISDGRAHSIGYKSEPDIDASAAGLGMGRVGRRGRSKGRDTRSRRPIDLGRTWKFASCEVEGRCAKAGAECKNLGRVVLASGEGRARSIGYKSEGDGGCAKAGAASARISGRVVLAAAKDERVRSGTSRKETVGARRPELKARISGRVVLASGDMGKRIRSGTSRNETMGARRPERDASRHGCAVQGSAESKSEGDMGASAAGLAGHSRGEVKAKVEIDRSRRPIDQRPDLRDRKPAWVRCARQRRVRSQKTDIGASAAGLAVGTVGREVESKGRDHEIETANRSKAGLARSQAGIGALNRAVHGQSRRQTSVRERPDLPWVESAKKSKQETK